MTLCVYVIQTVVDNDDRSAEWFAMDRQFAATNDNISGKFYLKRLRCGTTTIQSFPVSTELFVVPQL